jgi:hypothetical protein
VSVAGDYRGAVDVEIRSRFVKTLVESVQVWAGSGALEQLEARLPPRLSLLLAEAMASRDAADTVSLDDAEALFLEVDSVMSDGAGHALEGAGRGLAARTLAEAGIGPLESDLLGAVRRLETPIAQSMVGASPTFETTPTEDGFVLIVGIAGRPRFARLLRHLITGYLQGAATGARGNGLRVFSDTLGDRARITVRYDRTAEDPALATPAARPPVSRRRASSSFQTGSLSAEVERILAGAPPSRSSEHPPRSRRSSAPAPDDETVDDTPTLPPRKAPRG